jgi:hypothetical protein
MRVVLMIMGLVLGCCAAARAQGWADFPPYPGSLELCDQRVHGNVAHFHWTAYTTVDVPETVVAFYADRLGKPETDQDERSFKIEKDGVVVRVLSVYPVTGRYPRCGKDPDPGARTMLIVSRPIAR